MSKMNDDLAQLRREILCGPSSAALPVHLSDHWMNLALQSVERVISGDADTDAGELRIPLNLVLHLLNAKMTEGTIEMSDEDLFDCIKCYRWELAMEKLRRWGVRLTPPATIETIFDSPKRIMP
jgi:hypothetical protein